jgi:hypothetical protein
MQLSDSILEQIDMRFVKSIFDHTYAKQVANDETKTEVEVHLDKKPI